MSRAKSRTARLNRKFRLVTSGPPPSLPPSLSPSLPPSRRCTYRPSVIYLIVYKLLSLSLSLSPFLPPSLPPSLPPFLPYGARIIYTLVRNVSGTVNLLEISSPSIFDILNLLRHLWCHLHIPLDVERMCCWIVQFKPGSCHTRKLHSELVFGTGAQIFDIVFHPDFGFSSHREMVLKICVLFSVIS